MKSWCNSLLLAYLSLFFPFVAQSTQKSTETFVISHVSHPQVAEINLLIERAYQQIGIKVEFIPVPAIRGLTLVNDGIVDADSIRIFDNLKDYKNITFVEPAFNNLKFVLVCKRNIPCSADILKDKQVTVLAARGRVNLIGEDIIAANMVLNENLDVHIELLRAGRYYYALYASGGKYLQQLTQEFNVKEIALPKFYTSLIKNIKRLFLKLKKAYGRY